MPRLCIVPSGAEYCAPESSPKQHIRCRKRTQWQPGPSSKFEVDDTHLWRNQRPAALAYWSPFDHLSLFLSKMGPAPNFGSATDVNFYLPLTAVYARFYMWIGLNKRPALTDDKPEDSREREGLVIRHLTGNAPGNPGPASSFSEPPYWGTCDRTKKRAGGKRC
jgi:hypothetical protein